MTLMRASWITTVVVCVITAALLFLSDYIGVALAVGASAAINIR